MPSQSMLLEIDKLVKQYQPSNESVELVKDSQVVLLVGISGAGKDTIKKRLLEDSQFYHIVSHTTRQPRANGGVMEMDGLDYHFISLAKAEKMLLGGQFIEAKKYGSNIYGTSAQELMNAKQADQIAVTDVEVQGVREYKAISGDVVAIFILPPSYEVWQQRLLSRYAPHEVDNSDIESRMITAIAELTEALNESYYHFVINDNLDQSAITVAKIARGGNSFNQKDDLARQRAEQLLAELKRGIA